MVGEFIFPITPSENWSKLNDMAKEFGVETDDVVSIFRECKNVRLFDADAFHIVRTALMALAKDKR